MFLKQYFKVCNKNKYILSIENDTASGELTAVATVREHSFYRPPCPHFT